MRQSGRSAGKIGPLDGFSAGDVTRQASARITVATPGPGFTDITEAVADFVAQSGLRSGLRCRRGVVRTAVPACGDPDAVEAYITYRLCMLHMVMGME